MDITVRATKGTLVIDSATQVAFMLPAEVAWTDDGGVTGHMTLQHDKGRLVPNAFSISGPVGFDAQAYWTQNARRIIKAAKPKLAVPVSSKDGVLKVETNTDAIGVDEIKPARRWQRLSPEFLAEVAAVYKAAEADGLPPTKTVMEQWDAVRPRVDVWIAECRALGLIPPSGRPSRKKTS